MRGYIAEIENVASESIGYRIRYFRQQAGLTQKELGDLCGLHDSTIRNYELANRIPDIDKINKIASVLGVSPYAISAYDPDDCNCAVQLLFQLEKLIDLHPDCIDEQAVLIAEGVPGFIDEWKEQYKLFKDGKISEAEYMKWQSGYQYPKS